ncbi:hypothetical protein HK102_000441 [Quaeritorhiza haematococci]|nr:hypothetical protein HK102_000441 [Quaeritorhiza haematococci]
MGNITDSKKYSVSEDNIARANNTPGDFPGMHIVTRHEKDNGWDFGWDEDFEDEIRRADRRSEHSSVPGLPAALATVDRKISRSASTPSSTTLSSLSGNSGSKDEQKRRQDRREARQLELAILRRQRGSRSASISGDSGSNAQLAALRHSKDGIHLDRAVIEAKLAKIDKQLSSKSSVAVTGEKQGSKSSVVVRKDGDTKVNGKSPNNTTTQPSSGRNSTLMAVAVMQATSDEPNYFQGMEPVYRSPPVVDATTKKMLLEAGNVWKGAVYNNGVEAAPATPPKSEKMKPKPKEERANTKPPVKVKSKTVRVETRLPRRASTGKKSWSPAGGAELADGKIGRPSSAGARPQAIGNTSSRLAMSPSPEGATTATGWGAELGEEFADVEI